MTEFASMVVRLLEDLKRLTTPDQQAPPSAVTEDARPPKRPWEDSSREDEQAARIEVFLLALSIPARWVLIIPR